MGERKRLRPYQRRALAYCLRERNPALFLDMRLGKTLISIRFAKLIRAGRVLVIAPNSALESWRSELESEGERSVAFLQGPRQRRLESLNSGARWSLINKEGWTVLPEIGGARHCSACSGRGKMFDPAKTCRNCSGVGAVASSVGPRWDLVILDESTCIKNPKARISKFFGKFFYNAKRRAILTGTPLPESPLDIHNQYLFLDRGRTFGRNFWAFRIANFKPIGYDWTPSPGVRELISKKISQSAFILNRKDVFIEESKVYTTRSVSLPASMQKTYDEAEESFILETDGMIKETKTAVVVFSMLRQFASGFFPRTEDSDVKQLWAGKLLELARILKEETTGQVVVWFAFNHELATALDFLRQVEESCRWVTGAVAPAKRRELERDFKRGNFRVLLAQVEVGKFGANFSAADTAIYFSRPLGMETRAQSEDRVVNVARRYPALIMDIVTSGTIDADVLALLQEKRSRSVKIMDVAKMLAERRVKKC